jgi:hypothetical protein
LKTALNIRPHFDRNYFLISLGLLIIEILIAKYLHDDLIRPYGGDFLVVILLFCLVKTFLEAPAWLVALAVLLFSYFVEWTQYLNLADRLKLRRHSLLRILMGDYFSWTDIGCYTLGILTVLILEKMISNGKKTDKNSKR